MSYCSFSPITGYTGHIPGDKWVIGTARRSQSWHRGKQGIGEGLSGGGGSGLMIGNGVGGSGLLMDVQDPLMEGIVRMDLDGGGEYKTANKIGHRQKRNGRKDEENVKQAKEVDWIGRREDERPETEEEGIDEEEEEQEEEERRRRRMNMRESLDKESQRDLTDEQTEKEEEQEAALEVEEDTEVEVKYQRRPRIIGKNLLQNQHQQHRLGLLQPVPRHHCLPRREEVANRGQPPLPRRRVALKRVQHQVVQRLRLQRKQ